MRLRVMSEMVARSSRSYLLFGGGISLLFAVCMTLISVEPYIVPMFNSWRNLLWGIVYLTYIFISLYLFSFSIKNYTLWGAEE